MICASVLAHLGIHSYSIPCDFNIKLNRNIERTVAQLEYASAISSMMYAMHCTKPDMVYVVCKLSRFTVIQKMIIEKQ